MSGDRSTPEEILKRIQAEEKQKENEKRGKLYIFLGYAAGERGIFVTGGRNPGFTRASEAWS